jgi:hypothetical protein
MDGNPYSDDPNVKTLSRSDIDMYREAYENDWVSNPAFYEEFPQWLYDTWKHAKSARLRFKAGHELSVLLEKKKAREAKQGGSSTVNVTVNQHAGDGGTINNGNQEALDAAAAFIRAMASDESDPSRTGVVRDAGNVQSPPTLGPPEPEAP